MAGSTAPTLEVLSTFAYSPPGAVADNRQCLLVTATSTGTMTVQSAPMPVDPAFTWIGSAYVYAYHAPPRSVQMTLQIENANGNGIQGYPGAVISEESTIWSRPYALVPPSQPLDPAATQARLVVQWFDVPAGEQHLLDCALFEEGWTLNDYFDGGVFGTTDYLWSTPGSQVGPSYYYRNFVNKESRLLAVLHGDTPDGQRSPLTVTGFLPAGRQAVLVTPAGQNP